jgi:hypothetical protein
MAPRSRQVMLSCPSSLPGHSDLPTPIACFSPVSSNLIHAYRRRSPAETLGSQVLPPLSVTACGTSRFIGADGLTPGPCQVLARFTSLTTLAFSLKKEDRLHSPGGLKKKTHILGIFFLDILLPSFYIRFILKQVLSGPSKLGASYGVQVSIG